MCLSCLSVDVNEGKIKVSENVLNAGIIKKKKFMKKVVCLFIINSLIKCACSFGHTHTKGITLTGLAISECFVKQFFNYLAKTCHCPQYYLMERPEWLTALRGVERERKKTVKIDYSGHKCHFTKMIYT